MLSLAALQFGGYAVDPIPTMKAQQLVQQLKAAGKPVKEGMFFVAGYDPVRHSMAPWCSARNTAWLDIDLAPALPTSVKLECHGSCTFVLAAVLLAAPTLHICM
jgi:hypothetical protein